MHLKYWAFISYSHRDRRWGDWLHRTLETYRVPRRLVGLKTRDEPIPARLFPIFRDRDELPGSSDLSDQINQALAQSRFLIVVCSPHAATSHWVNEEIKAFKRLGRTDLILCLIVDGEPNATHKPDSAARECFPEALRFRMADDGTLTAERTEPIAADVREGQDGKHSARLKLIAGILGVGYDELHQRDRQRRNWRRLQAATAGVLLAGLLAGIWQWQEREKARLAQGELIERYVEEGRQELLAERPQRAAALLTEAYRLGARGTALRQLLSVAYQPADSEPVAIVGHAGEVTSADFSPDGRWLATASWDGTARVWDARNAKQVAALADHGRTVTVARFDPYGRRLLTAGWDATARLWDASSWKLLATLKGHSDRITTAAFSADGQRIVTAGFDKDARVWDVESGKLVATLTGHTDSIMAASFDPQRARVLTGSLDSKAKIWDANTGAELGSLSGHTDRLTSAEFSPKGDQVATASFDKSARLWNAGTMRPTAVLQGHALPVVAVAFSPDGSRLATAGWDKTARLWDTGSGKPVATLEGHGLAVLSVAFDDTGARLATSSWDKSVKIWDTASGKLLASLEGHSNIARSAAFSRDGNFVASASFDNTAKIWNVGLENRSPEQLLALMKCRVPWRVQQGHLEAARIDPGACVARSGT